MKFKISALALLLIVSLKLSAQIDRTKAPEPGPAPQINLEEPKTFELKNGVKVLVVESHKLPRVSYTLRIDNNPVAELDKAGVSEILSSVLGNGTTSIAKDEFTSEIDYLGANLSFGPQNAFASGLSKYSERILELMADAVINPLITDEEFQKVKDRAVESVKNNNKDVSNIASRISTALSYGLEHPYGEFTSEESLKNVTVKDVKDYYNKNFNPNNAYLVIIGDISFEKIKKQIKASFGKWEKVELIDYSVPEPDVNPSGTEIDFVDMPNAVQSNIIISNNVKLKMNDDDYFAALIANSILGGGATGYLFQNLRDDKAYTYGSYSRIGASRYNASRFSATAQVRNEVTDSSVVEMLKEIKRLRNEPVTAETLKNAKAQYLGRYVRAIESPRTTANFALNIETNNLDKDFYKNYLTKINAVSQEDVQRVANKYFKPENSRVVVAGKGSDILENLEKTGIPIKYYDTHVNAVEKPTYEIPMPADMSANKVLNAYIEAIGGKDNLDKVNSVFITAEAELQPGVMMNLEMKKTVKNQSLQQITVMGQSQKQVLDGNVGYSFAQGQKKDMTEDEVKNAQVESSPFPEVNYLNGGVTLDKIEKLESGNAYKINIDDNTSIYYSVETGLKVMEVKTTPAGASTTYYNDHKEVAGVKFPFKIGQTFGPRKFDFAVKEIKVNEGVSDVDFD